MDNNSIADALMLEKMGPCNCHRNSQSIFVCLKSEHECKDSSTQKYYCILCSQEDKHDHKPISIVSELKVQNKNWTSFMTELTSTFSAAENAYKELWPLIVYLEEAMMQPGIAISKPVKWLTVDFVQLKTLHDNVIIINNGQIKQLYSEAKLLELFQLTNQLAQFKESFEPLKYLGNLNEQLIWEQYHSAISVAGKTKFENFTQDNIQAFYRLKLQSIEDKLRGGTAQSQHFSEEPYPAHMPAVEQRLFNIEQQIVNLFGMSKPQPPPNLQPINECIERQALEIDHLKQTVHAQEQHIQAQEQSLQAQAQTQQVLMQANQVQAQELLKINDLQRENESLRAEVSNINSKIEHLVKSSKIVEESKLLKEEIDFLEIKQRFMTESILIDKAESIKFLMNHIQEALGNESIFAQLRLRGSRDGFTQAVFHTLCDNQGPLLVLFQTRKDILCGGFSSIGWKNSGDWIVDPKCFIFSLKLQKVYQRRNDTHNLYFNASYGPWFGGWGSLGINRNKKLHSQCNYDPFHVPQNAFDLHEITEELHESDVDFKDYEVFAISTQ